MSDPTELYKQAVVEHSKHPRNEGPLPEATAEATTVNPLCGDKVTVRAVVEDGRLVTLRFEGRGCAIAMASASMMAELLEGQSVEEALQTATTLAAVVAGEQDGPNDPQHPIARLRGVRAFPARRRCATLAWETLTQAVSPSG